ncbi:hypothetical protein Asi02nite_37620 [Asanoa siamensis]|uniref:Uncharacterized protein n=1 Tax=Asanoa siamensis TaxID=926357 RepID=A0ABQ4CSI3_9ACTN|nr:hypothetical protein Asi02nite_37620 [Asanoa siamensis]
MAMCAGQSVNLVHETLPVARLVRALVEKAAATIESLWPR